MQRVSLRESRRLIKLKQQQTRVTRCIAHGRLCLRQLRHGLAGKVTLHITEIILQQLLTGKVPYTPPLLAGAVLVVLEKEAMSHGVTIGRPNSHSRMKISHNIGFVHKMISTDKIYHFPRHDDSLCSYSCTLPSGQEWRPQLIHATMRVEWSVPNYGVPLSIPWHQPSKSHHHLPLNFESDFFSITGCHGESDP